MEERYQKYYLLIRLNKNGSSFPAVGGAIISAEHPGDITTDYSSHQYLTMMVIEATSYTEAEKQIVELIRKTPYDAWLRPYFCKSLCAKAYMQPEKRETMLG